VSVFINVPNNVEKVNLLMSGGADSTLLLYLLVKEKVQNERTYEIQNHTRIDGGRIDYYIVKPILGWLADKFGVKMHTKAWRNNLIGAWYIRPIAAKLIEIEGGVVYSGCNAVPDIATTWVKKVPFRGEETHPLHFRPFINLEKTDIIRLYKENQILDLLEMTVSCINCADHIKAPCGKCFFCKELEWAKNQIG
jgi:7-cyano-7-deazaguanine synthase in queuosine biosynthesis